MSEVSIQKTTHWASIREAGTLFGLKLLWAVQHVFGRKALSAVLWPVAGYFVLFRKQTRQGSQQFLAKHYRYFPDFWARRPNLFNVAKHFKIFSEAVVDKLLSWRVEIDATKFHIVDENYLESALSNPVGRLVIGSHFGNLEYCRGFVHRYRDRTINILIHDAHTENYNSMMRMMNPESRLNIMQVSEFDIPAMLRIKNKIDNGEWIFIAGDRTPPSGNRRTANVDFLGETAAFPIGPYLLAQGLKCPVELIFSYCDYDEDSHITVDLKPFADKIILDRSNREEALQQYAQSYAAELERHCAAQPYQWFNFYDFWADHE